MLKIYHNPQCRKSRAGLQYLQDKKVAFEVVEYLKDRLSEPQLERLLMKLNKKPQEVVRTQEKYYKTSLKGKNFNHHEWIRIIAEYPKLLCRPIVEREYRAVIGDPVENIDQLLR
ncbi:MAG TPA: ArsC/Spx/MgsR family protein [Bacteroidales bacterium]|nr:ArsC/Spx/MgsR family protein [Bacteroidales bacterium]